MARILLSKQTFFELCFTVSSTPWWGMNHITEFWVGVTKESDNVTRLQTREDQKFNSKSNMMNLRSLWHHSPLLNCRASLQLWFWKNRYLTSHELPYYTSGAWNTFSDSRVLHVMNYSGFFSIHIKFSAPTSIILENKRSVGLGVFNIPLLAILRM